MAFGKNEALAPVEGGAAVGLCRLPFVIMRKMSSAITFNHNENDFTTRFGSRYVVADESRVSRMPAATCTPPHDGTTVAARQRRSRSRLSVVGFDSQPRVTNTSLQRRGHRGAIYNSDTSVSGDDG